MAYLNIEIKARCENPAFIRNYLLQHRAEFKGIDHQTDTYFNVLNGRLKLREGNIENNLIYYYRNNEAGPKPSDFNLLAVPDAAALKEILKRSIGIKVVVSKQREIYFIENIKFHIDELPQLGSFIEIEASNKYADLPKEKLQQQCEFYMHEFKIKPADLLAGSYSDMLMDLQL